MNEIYLIIMGCVIIITIIGWITTDMLYAEGVKPSLVVLGIIVSFLMILSSGMGFGIPTITTKNATNTRVGDELVIQAPGFPTQNVTDIKYVDKSVKITETITRNAWGGGIDVGYSITTSEIPEKN